VSASVCTATSGCLRGIETLTIANGALSVVVLVGKGADIYTIRDAATGVDPLLKAPWGLQNPARLVPSGSPLVDWVLRYPGGWQVLLPNFGPACSHRGIAYPMHGEAAVVPWKAEILHEGDDAVEVSLDVELVLTPLRLERRIRLERGRRVVTVAERLSNVGPAAVDYMWGHHPAVGAPFLSPSCRIDTGARELVVDAEYESPFLPLERGARCSWSSATSTGLAQPPPPDERRDLVAYLLGFDNGWWAVTNLGLGLGFGLSWDAGVFPVACLWQEFRATGGYPWFCRGYALAIEPNTSWPAAGIATVARTSATQRCLEPEQTVETELRAVVYESRSGVDSIDREGSVRIARRSGAMP
jgi:Domain of unknown function (DUF4432)